MNFIARNNQILRNAKQHGIRRAIQHVVALKIKGLITLKYARRMMQRIKRALKSKSVIARFEFITDYEYRLFDLTFDKIVINTNRMQRSHNFVPSLKIIA